MFPSERGGGRPPLCVAIHDVAPATWPACLRLLNAVREVADIPLTWLVVPRFHGNPRRDLACEAMLGALAEQGHELALHGYTHLDQAAPPATWRQRLQRQVLTQGEGEFAAIGSDEARRRIELGLGWFRQRGWRAAGFVAPAWLLGAPAWAVLPDYPFTYTTSYTRFFTLPGRRSLLSPALVYAARNCAGRMASPPAASVLAAGLRHAPLVRVALHPRDAQYPALLRHAQRLLLHLLDSREAMTKASAAARFGALLTSTAPSTRPAPSDADRSRRSTMDRSAEGHPWR